MSELCHLDFVLSRFQKLLQVNSFLTNVLWEYTIVTIVAWSWEVTRYYCLIICSEFKVIIVNTSANGRKLWEEYFDLKFQFITALRHASFWSCSAYDVLTFCFVSIRSCSAVHGISIILFSLTLCCCNLLPFLQW